ncbi:TonB-dependent receptor [Sphingomonas japonica]|uniref:Iron complex outermembrane receptor protein n=1 Tax=Sphingomonas japonica TaxID=511662 RepID=A0ABX0U2J0_9SPHN|nr:TonB-dependent receptor [Sphingomonas japonica]NIJ24714.1 iron complex outermembrane receptor protein [Sphingomonas japonica]
MKQVDGALAAGTLAMMLVAGQAVAQERDTASDDIVVTARGSQVELVPEYPGGQVARGARAGLLGNLDYMDAPFSTTAYTENLIREQQAESVADVLQNDPGIRVARGFGNFQELYYLRGFLVYSDDLTYNGLYGILPRQYVAAEMLERVEVFRGANSFVNGAAPGGSAVGGAINLVPKRAPEDDLNRATIGIGSRLQGYATFDFARRLGRDDALGLRANAAVRGGDTEVDGQKRLLTVASIGTDYRSGDFRFSADIGYQDQRIDAPRPSVTPLGAIPAPPEADANFAQPWTYTEERQLFGVARAELDVTPGVTLWAAGGGRIGEEENVLANPDAQADGTTTAYRFDNTREDRVLSADAGIRADFDTGPIGHRVIASGAIYALDSKNAYAFSNFAGFVGDLYDPFTVAPPATDFFVGGVLADPLTTLTTDTRSAAIADTLSLFGGKLLTTAGVRWQRIDTASFDYNTGAELPGRNDKSAWTPAFGLVVKPDERLSLYANYAESLVPGEIAPASVGTTPVLNAGEVFAPYRADQLEFGAKLDLVRFGATLGVFTTALPSAYVIDQRFTIAGEQRHRGIEATLFGEPVDGVRLVGGMTVIDAELVDTGDAAIDGNQAIGVPGLQANLNAEWDVAATGLTLEGRAIHSSSQFVDESNSRTIPDWTKFDLGIRYAVEAGGKPLTLRVRAENLTDEAYWASAGGFPGSSYLVLGNPRSIFVSATVGL